MFSSTSAAVCVWHLFVHLRSLHFQATMYVCCSSVCTRAYAVWSCLIGAPDFYIRTWRTCQRTAPYSYAGKAVFAFPCYVVHNSAWCWRLEACRFPWRFPEYLSLVGNLALRLPCLCLTVFHSIRKGFSDYCWIVVGIFVWNNNVNRGRNPVCLCAWK